MAERKMKEVNDYGTWNPQAPGDAIQGTYVRKDTNIGELKSTKFVIQTEEGGDIGVWGTATLEPRMERVSVGSFVRIEFIGTKKTKFKNDMKLFKVMVEEVDHA